MPAKIKFTKGELKRQRDDLKQFERYLPTLQLKKQQLQLEILTQRTLLQERSLSLGKKKQAIDAWSGLFNEPAIDLKPFLSSAKVATRLKNIAGVDIPVFSALEFAPAVYDLFITPLWIDTAVDLLRAVIVLKQEVSILEKGIVILRHELRTTTQRVNLFEKVLIPQAEENIRLIKIYIGDQMANAVGRSKIAKRKIEELVLAGEAA